MKFDWRKLYILPRKTTKNTYLRSFQYKILNNILFLNKKLFVFQVKNTPLEKKNKHCLCMSLVNVPL